MARSVLGPASAPAAGQLASPSRWPPWRRSTTGGAWASSRRRRRAWTGRATRRWSEARHVRLPMTSFQFAARRGELQSIRVSAPKMAWAPILARLQFPTVTAPRRPALTRVANPLRAPRSPPRAERRRTRHTTCIIDASLGQPPTDPCLQDRAHPGNPLRARCPRQECVAVPDEVHSANVAPEYGCS